MSSFAGFRQWLASLSLAEKTAVGGLVGWIALTTTYLRPGADYFIYLSLAALAVQVAGGRPLDLGGRTGAWLLLLGTAAILSTPTSIWLGRSLVELVELGKLLVIFFLTVHVLRSPKSLRYLLGLAVILLASFPAVGSIAAFLTGDVEVAGRADWTGYFRNANLLAAVLVLFVPVPVVWTRTSRKLSAKVFWALCAIVMSTGILLSGSRSGTLGLAVVVLWAAWSARDRIKAVVTMSVLAVLLLGFGPPEWRARVGTMAYAVTGSRAPESRSGDVTNWEHRVLIWKAGLAAVQDNVVLGTGPGTFEETHRRYQDPFLWTEGRRWREAHNAYLRVWVEMGIVGLIAFLGLLVSVLRRGVGQLRRLRMLNLRFGEVPLLLGGMLAGLTGFFVSNFFNTLTHLWYFYFFLGALTLVMREARRLGDAVTNSGTFVPGKGMRRPQARESLSMRMPPDRGRVPQGPAP